MVHPLLPLPFGEAPGSAARRAAEQRWLRERQTDPPLTERGYGGGEVRWLSIFYVDLLVSLRVIMDGNLVPQNSTAPQLLRCWASRGCGSEMPAHATWLQGTWLFPYMGCITQNVCMFFCFQSGSKRVRWYFCWLGLPALRKNTHLHI